MSKGKSKLPALLGVAAVGVYRYYKGKGVFNKVRFKQQHEAVSKYLETHYPNAFYSAITETDGGWSCVVTDISNKKVVLYMTQTDGGMFVFWEKEI